MDFVLDERQEALQRRVAEFCGKHCTPEAAEAIDREKVFPEALYAALAREGLLRACFPEEYGGAGGGLFDVVLITEGLARASGAAVNMFLVNSVFAGATLVVGGTDAQKAKFLPGIGEGRLRLAFAMTEPEAGSDAGGIKTSAARDGEEFVINGTKTFTTGASVADYIVTVARTTPEGKASRGSSILLVPREAPGLKVTAMDKIAGNAFASCDVRYDDVRVPSASLLGGPEGLDRAWNVLMLTGAMERICVAASALGLAQTIFEEARRHATSRRQFGQPISRFQAIQHALVDMATEIEAMRWLTYSAAWKADRGEFAAKEISMAKYYCSEKVTAMAIQGMKILGGLGYLRGTPMSRHLREAMLGLYAGGTTEIQKNLIAKILEL